MFPKIEIHRKRFTLVKFKSQFYNWVDSTTIHDLHKVFGDNNNWQKIFWSLSLLISVSVCSYLISKSITEYLGFEVNSKIRIYSVSNLEFPSVTICNKNSFIYDVSNSMHIDQYQENSTFEENFYRRIQNDGEIKLKIGIHTNSTIKKHFGISLQDMILVCTFAERKCDLDDFEWIYNHYYGNCYRFNGKSRFLKRNTSLRHVFKSGKGTGLYLELYSGLLNKNITIAPNYRSDYGFHLLIYNSSINPTFSNEGFDIKMNSLTNIAIKQKFMYQQPVPYSQCEEVDFLKQQDFYKLISKTGSDYSRKICLPYCLQEFFLKLCDCNIVNFPRLNESIPYCQGKNLGCAYGHYYGFIKNHSAECNKKCPLECQTVSYELSTSFANYPSKEHAKLIKKHLVYNGIADNKTSISKINDNVASVDIYYEEMLYTEMTEVPSQTITGLLSSIGGTLGLLLGMSLLSIIELFELVITLLLNFCSKK